MYKHDFGQPSSRKLRKNGRDIHNSDGFFVNLKLYYISDHDGDCEYDNFLQTLICSDNKVNNHTIRHYVWNT